MVVVVHERSSPVKGFSYSDLTEKFVFWYFEKVVAWEVVIYEGGWYRKVQL